MKLEEVLDKMRDPTNLADWREVDELIFWCSGFIGDYEEQLAELDQVVAVKYDDLAEDHGSDAAGKRKLALTDVYKDQKLVERRIRQLKAFRTNLKRRYEILTSTFR